SKGSGIWEARRSAASTKRLKVMARPSPKGLPAPGRGSGSSFSAAPIPPFPMDERSHGGYLDTKGAEVHGCNGEAGGGHPRWRVLLVPGGRLFGGGGGCAGPPGLLRGPRGQP